MGISAVYVTSTGDQYIHCELETVSCKLCCWRCPDAILCIYVSQTPDEPVRLVLTFTPLLLLLTFQQFLKRARQLLKQPYWSLATYVRQNSRFARSIIRRFEIEVAREARSRELDGAICGHIHCPALKWIGNRIYGNSGDWVDNCTALVERPDGSLALMHYLPYFHRLQTKSEEQVEKEVKTSSDIPPGAYA